MLYSSVATGFRSGSWQARVNNANDFVNFPSEKLTTYEAGAKGDLFDGRFRWSVAAFYNDFRDLLSSAPGGNDGFPVLTIDAETYRLEGDFNFSANSWLQFFGNFGLLNADPTNVIPELAPFVGPRLQRSPTFSGKLGFVVDYPLEKGALLLNGDVFYTSKYYTNPQNTPASVTGDYALINAKIGYRFENEKYKVTFGCTNCADKEYFDNILDFASFGFTTVFPGDPRLWEFSMSAEF
jgi:iron complex outermembrane receptor protein